MSLSTKTQVKETFISPAFYTTDITKMSEVDTVIFAETFDAVLVELQKDHNKDKYIRNESFVQSWDYLQGEVREIIIKILEMYCAAEYAGFILYKELSYQLKDTNNLLSDAFSFMARDEARHASFLNKALLDFHLKPNLGFLKKENRKYFILPFSYFVYSTYLSEKLSSYYYITVFKHLKSYPMYSIYPLFEYYQAWSEDESRHGDFWGAIIQTQPQFTKGLKAKWVCKFYLVLIFSMTYLRHQKNEKIFKLFELDTRKYSISTIKKANKSIEKNLPIILDIENSRFFNNLDSCLEHIIKNDEINISVQHILLKSIKKIPHYLSILFVFPSLFLVKTIDTRKKREV